jgi:Na+/H+-translocating membrane pyrophosphatase
MERGLKLYLIGSTVLMSPVVWMLSMHVTSKSCAIAILLGLLSGLVIGLVTTFYTSSSYVPETQKQSAATGIVYCLALGHLSRSVPVFCLAVTVSVARKLCGRFGVALAPATCLGEDRA